MMLSVHRFVQGNVISMLVLAVSQQQLETSDPAQTAARVTPAVSHAGSQTLTKLLTSVAMCPQNQRQC